MSGTDILYTGIAVFLGLTGFALMTHGFNFITINKHYYDKEEKK